MSDIEIINNIDTTSELISCLEQRKSYGIFSASDKMMLAILKDNHSKLTSINANNNVKKRVRTIKK